MSGASLSYAAVTPARNEAEHIARLGESLASQSVPPTKWLIVDNGSTDDTVAVAHALAADHSWITVVSIPGELNPVRGRPIVRAFTRALEELDPAPDLVVNVDADVSMDADYFERLLDRFLDDRQLGICSGSAFELSDGVWTQRHVTGSTVWGATRAYRWACLQDVLPLEERLGWDGLDEFKANARGWRTRTFTDIPFRHHRREGERDGERWRARAAQGAAAHYQGYAFWYLVMRALHNARKEPGALGLIWGYLRALAAREPRCPDTEARAYLRDQQSLRNLARRFREASRPAATLDQPDRFRA
jgi:glycosyltransferase involved in cell wall biosynthesis